MQAAAQRAERRRGIKTTVNRASRFALIYMIVFMGAYLLCQLALEAIAKHMIDTGGAGFGHALALLAIINGEGLLYLFAVAVGVIVLMLMRGGMVCSASLWLGERGRDGRRTGRLMKPAWLVVFFALVIGVQGVLEITQIVLAMFGIRFVSLTDGAQGLAGTVLAGGAPLGAWHAGLGGPVDPNYFSPVGSFFVGGTCYAWFLAPIVEEIVFRGVVMGTLKPLGRKFAILTSAIMFGLFHDDLVQGLFAFGLGLILGFVAMEYSLLWSIALHMFNNAVLSGLFIDVFASSLGDDAVVICMLLLMVVGIVGLIVVFTRFGSGLRRYSRKHRTAAGTYGAAWTSGWFVAFVVVNVALTVAFAVLTAMGS
ncbi:CPBP family intramembrane glutamic endopeptidase [Bifidobacterium jacchi]|nr:CPBP family intramembrane glutamic endopeptidase [Bifidobacterium jacchi]